MKQKLSIEEVDNGYIVRVIRTGLSELKDPYEKPVLVFQSYAALTEYLKLLKPASFENRRP